MKRNIAFGFALLGLISLSACESDHGITPEKVLTPRATASARYIVPLTTGRDNGENTIVDPTNAARTNIAELLPTLKQIVADASSGRINTYPDGNATDPQNDPKTFFQRNVQQMESAWRPIKDGEFVTGFEMECDLEAYDGYVKVKPKLIDLIWTDSGNTYPDRRMCSLRMADLKDYPVRKGASTISLPDYLSDQSYEHYVIRVYAADTFGIRNYADARTVQQQLEQGHFDVENPWKPN